MIFYVLFIFCSISYFLILYFSRTFDHWKKKNVKGPEPTVLFGNFKNVALMREMVTFRLKKIYDEYRDEPIVGMYRMTTPWLIIKDLDILKHVMIKDFDVFSDRGTPVINKKLETHLFASDTDVWRVLRHKFTPLFTSGKLKNMFHLISERGDKFLDYVDKISQKTPDLELHSLLQRFTLSSVSACAFGIDLDLMGDDSYLKSLSELDTLIFKRRSTQDIAAMYPMLVSKFSALKFSKIVYNFFNDLVTTVIKQRNGKSVNRNDFVDLLLDLRNEGEITSPKREGSKELTLEITDDIMVAQAFIFYLAGYKTSATTMSFMLYELARNPNIQAKLHQEIDNAINKANGKFTYDTLGQLSYMEKVFDETLRKYPVGDPIFRRASSTYKIPKTNVTIEKGQTIIVSVRGIHYDETLYPEPEVFDPERFDPKVSRERHPCAYIPFGIGPRNCIGLRFAKVQSRLCMVKLLSRYRVELTDQKEMTYDMTRILISPRKGYKLKFCPRNKDV